MVTEKQIKTLNKIFRRSGRTFQALARESGLDNIPDHMIDLTESQAKKLIKRCGMFLINNTKTKQ